MQIPKAVVGSYIHKKTEDNFIKTSVSVYLKRGIVSDGYILNITTGVHRMVVPRIKESFRWNMNPMSLSFRMFDS